MDTMVVETCLKCGLGGYQPSYQHPMQTVMQDEVAHICTACGYTWPREGRKHLYRKRYGEPEPPYGEPTPTGGRKGSDAVDHVGREASDSARTPGRDGDPTTGDTKRKTETRGPNWCENCGKDTPTIGYNLNTSKPDKRCALCATVK